MPLCYRFLSKIDFDRTQKLMALKIIRQPATGRMIEPSLRVGSAYGTAPVIIAKTTAKTRLAACRSDVCPILPVVTETLSCTASKNQSNTANKPVPETGRSLTLNRINSFCCVTDRNLNQATIRNSNQGAP